MVVRVVAMVGVVVMVVAFAKPSSSAAAPATAAPVGSGEGTATATPVTAALVGSGEDAATASGSPAHITGPRRVALGDNAEIDLPAGMILYERAVAQRLLRKVGEPVEGVVAIVLAPDAGWTVILSYTDAGYLDDTDASRLDAGDLLAEYTAGNRAQNARRRTLGTPELVIDSWADPPRYERVQHRLAWGVAAHTADGRLVNLFTRLLGRGGFLSVSLIDTAETIERSKLQARAILQATRFKPGARYEDHVPGDRSAGGGLRGLVLGSAGVAVASKLGVVTKVMLGLKNAILFFLLGVLAVGEMSRRLFLRKPREAPADHAAAADPVDAASSSVAKDVASATVAKGTAVAESDVEELTAADLIAFGATAAAARTVER